MAVEVVGVSAGEPECDLCLDNTKYKQKWTPIEMFERSGLRGCTLCSLISAGVRKMETKDFERQPHLRSSPRNHGQESNDNMPWTECQMGPTQQYHYNPETMQVKVRDKYGREGRLEFYYGQGSIPQISRILPRTHVNPTLDLRKALSFIQGRLVECEANHECTPLKPMRLPKRVLDVGFNEDSNIFIYETQGEPAPYVTFKSLLGKGIDVEDDEGQLPSETSRVPWSQFPATFKDAINITRALHIQYLWIDSLCIIQNDKLDWEEQSALMASIYSNCYLNLAATHSAASNGGLFFDRWVTSFDEQLVSKKHSIEYHLVHEGEAAEGTVKTFVRRSLTNVHEDMLVLDGGDRVYNVVECAPLVTRAWAYQERLLSPRTVNFHSAELTWDCGGLNEENSFDCECGQLKEQSFVYGNGDLYVLEKTRFVGRAAKFLIPEEAFTTWMDVILQFSKLKLTFAQDKLPALAGIADRVANITNSKYLAGLWEGDLARGLLWRADYSPGDGHYLKNMADVGTRADPYRAPTWSWASIDFFVSRPCSKWISYEFALGLGSWIDSRFEVLECKSQVRGSNPYGQVVGGQLRMKGVVLITTFLYDSFYDLTNNTGEGSYYFDFNIFKKNSPYIPDDAAIIALLIGGKNENCFAIFIIPAKKDVGKYERIGIVEMKKKDFECAKENGCRAHLVLQCHAYKQSCNLCCTIFNGQRGNSRCPPPPTATSANTELKFSSIS